MKKILCAAFFLIMLAEQAMAAWTEDFTQNFKSLGMYDAVRNALADGVKPHDILDFVKKNPEQFDTHLSMKALYCAGENHDAVQEAAGQLGISEAAIGRALAESKKECGSMMSLTDRDIVDPPNHGSLSGTPPKGGVPADSGTPAAPPAADNAAETGGKSKDKKAASPSLPPMPPVGPPPSPSRF